MKLRFGEFLVDTRERVLRCAHAEIQLEPLVFECITFLTSRPGVLIRTDELRARLWPGVHVTDSAQRRVINAARRALGDNGNAQGWIRTRKRLGYMFVGAVIVEPERSAGASDLLQAWPFVGRSEELALLEQWVERKAPGGLCLLRAEAGAGKSSLLARLQERCGARGVWFTGQCHPEPEQPAFWPFREITRQLLSHRELAMHVRRLSRSAQSVSAAIPELAQDAHNRRPEPESAHARFESYEAWAELLATLSAVKPLFIVIEDAHWADDGSVWLLAALARAAKRAPLHVFVTYRPEALSGARSFTQLLSRVSGRDGVLDVALPGLSREALEILLASIELPGAAPRLAAELLRMTGGNALFVRELVRHALSTGSALGASIPASFQHIVAERVGFLPERSRELLEMGAILGRELETALLCEVACAGSLEQLLRELEPALDAGLLRTVNGRPDHLAFSHALIREALLAGMPAQRKQAHHVAALTALRAQPSAANQVALASHAFEAGGAVPRSERRALCERAGRALLSRLEFERAAQQLGRAVQLLPSDDSSAEGAALALAWARACWHADRPEHEVGSALLSAAQSARNAGQPQLLAEAAIMYAVGDESLLDSRILLLRPDALALAEEAWRALLAEAHGDEARLPRDLAHRLAYVRCWFRIESHDLETRGRLSQLVQRLAPAQPSPQRRCRLLGLRAVTEPAHTAQSLSELARHLRGPELDPRERIEGWIMLMALHLGQADLAQYESAVRELQDLAQPLADTVPVGRLGERISGYLLVPLLAAVTGCVIRGRLAEAVQRLAALPAASAGLGIAQARRADIHRFVLGRWLGAYLGQVDGLEAAVDTYITASPNARWQGPLWKMQLALQRGAPDAARKHYAQLRDSDFQPLLCGHQLPARVVSLAEIADACTCVGSQADAEVLYQRLLPHAQVVLLDGVMICWGACSRVLGALATQLDRPLEAERHLQHALSLNARLGHRPELVRTQLALARLYRRTGKPREAEALLGRARSDATAIGMSGFAFEGRE